LNSTPIERLGKADELSWSIIILGRRESI